jgi:hypothetical protein
MATIRPLIIARVEAATPTVEAAVGLPPVGRRRFAGPQDFRSWAAANPTACLRRFDVETPGDTDEVAVSSVTHEQVTESASIVVSYPRDNRYGGRNGLLDTIAADMTVLDDAAGTRGFSVNPIAATIIASDHEREEPDDAAVTFAVIPLRITYWRTPP